MANTIGASTLVVLTPKQHKEIQDCLDFIEKYKPETSMPEDQVKYMICVGKVDNSFIIPPEVAIGFTLAIVILVLGTVYKIRKKK